MKIIAAVLVVSALAVGNYAYKPFSESGSAECDELLDAVRAGEAPWRELMEAAYAPRIRAAKSNPVTRAQMAMECATVMPLVSSK